MNGVASNAIDLTTAAVISSEAFAEDPTNITVQDMFDISPEIQTTLLTSTAIKSAYPVEYSEINQ
ncbi:hypothetical protein ACG0Z5_22710 [Scandinavium sp. M-37]|uniref:hypothetical protein n=1 Tax=Scandinavium sp. M-37 TaxID=3373077 RepID=UPI003745D236